MNFQSHIFMSKVIIDHVNDRLPVKINRAAFRLGNVMADYSPLMFTHIHLPCYSMEYIKNKIRLFTDIPKDFDFIAASDFSAFGLGLLTHYICDFFCRAHSGTTFGNTREHMQYEDFLDNYRKTWEKELAARDWALDYKPMRTADEIVDYLETEVYAYHEREWSVEEDLTLAIENSIKILYSMAYVRFTANETVTVFSNI